MLGAGLIGSITQQVPLLAVFGSGLFIVGAIFLIGLAVLSIFVGRGLWKAQPWARIVAIIFAGLGILFAIISMIQGSVVGNIFSLVLNLAIGGYLLLSKKEFLQQSYNNHDE